MFEFFYCREGLIYLLITVWSHIGLYIFLKKDIENKLPKSKIGNLFFYSVAGVFTWIIGIGKLWIK